MINSKFDNLGVVFTFLSERYIRVYGLIGVSTNAICVTLPITRIISFYQHTPFYMGDGYPRGIPATSKFPFWEMTHFY